MSVAHINVTIVIDNGSNGSNSHNRDHSNNSSKTRSNSKNNSQNANNIIIQMAHWMLHFVCKRVWTKGPSSNRVRVSTQNA